DACAFHDRANSTTCNHTSTRCSGLHQNFARAMLTNDFVRNCSAGHWYFLHVAASSVNSLADCFRNFVCLPCCEADFALAIADCDECVEREATTSLHDFRNAVDCDHVLD